MPTPLASRFTASVAAQPAPWYVTGLGMVAAVVTTTAHLSPAWSAVVFSVAVAAGTIATAITARPVQVPVIGGAAAIVLGDLSLVGLKLTPDAIGVIVSAITFALGMILHLVHVQSVMPAPAIPALSPKQMRLLEQRVRAAMGLSPDGEVVPGEGPAAGPPPGPAVPAAKL